jgi:hypothetical protein
VRYTRHVLTRELKHVMVDNLSLGLALKGLEAVEYFITNTKSRIFHHQHQEMID